MKKFNIWAEPYLVTGMEGIPSDPILVARNIEAETFEDACDIVGKDPVILKGFGSYDPVRRSLWGCKLYPSRAEAEAPWAELTKRCYD